MISRIGNALSRAAGRTVPDPFVLALGLTLVVAATAWIALAGAAGATAVGAARILLQGWFDGFRDPAGLAFALQMCLVPDACRPEMLKSFGLISIPDSKIPSSLDPTAVPAASGGGRRKFRRF